MRERTVHITRRGEGISHAHAGSAHSVTALTSAQNPGGVAVQFADMPVGSGPPFHRHPSFDEVFIIVEGVVEFQVGHELHKAGAGDLVFVPGEVPHAPRCIEGNEDGVAKVIMLVTPARFEDFFHEMGELIASGNGTPAGIAALGVRYGIEFLDRPEVRARHE